jgi:hypothetical protein
MAQRLAQKYRALIQSEYRDEDGYWIALVPGYMDGTNPHCHEIHETDINMAYDVLRLACPCTCPEHRKQI